MAKYKKGREFSDERETRVLLEDLHSQFQVFGDGMVTMQEKMDVMQGKMDVMQGKIDVMQMDLTEVRENVGSLNLKVGNLEKEMSFVRKALFTVATKDDLKQLEKRLVALESTR